MLYVLADRLDDDPWLLLAWRGRTRNDVLAHLTSDARGTRDAVAPWWPLVPGAPLPHPAHEPDPWAATDTAETLTRLGPLDVQVRATPVTDLLAAAYQALAPSE